MSSASPIAHKLYIIQEAIANIRNQTNFFGPWISSLSSILTTGYHARLSVMLLYHWLFLKLLITFFPHLLWLTSSAITIYTNSIPCSRIAMLVTKSSTINTISTSYLSTPIPHPKIKIKYIMHKNKVIINKSLHKRKFLWSKLILSSFSYYHTCFSPYI